MGKDLRPSGQFLLGFFFFGMNLHLTPYWQMCKGLPSPPGATQKAHWSTPLWLNR
jgi:hypothetical protein